MSPEFNFTDVIVEVGKARLLRNLYCIQQVGGIFGVIVVRKLETVIEETKVKSNIHLTGCFPTEVRVSKGGNSRSRSYGVSKDGVYRIVNKRILRIVTDVIVTRYPYACSQFRKRDFGKIFHESLIRHYPTCGY